MPSVDEPEPAEASLSFQALEEAAQGLSPVYAAGEGSPPAASNGSLTKEAPPEEPDSNSNDDADGDVTSDDESQDGHGDANAVPSVVGTLEEASQLFEQGRKALGSEEYEEAAELLSRALEIRAQHYGDMALECAFTYYKYGCALLYKAQSETDALGGVKETGNNEKVEGEEDVDEDEESDLHMAWKMLDIARVIYEKQQSHSIEEVDVISALADVSLEREDFEMCLQDYTCALEILEGIVEPDDRGIAEICFKLSLALQLGYKPKDALRYCQRAVSVCEARLRRLKQKVGIAMGYVDSKGKAPASDLSDSSHLDKVTIVNSDGSHNNDCQKQTDEIKEIEGLLSELNEKVVELQHMASGPSLLESIKESNPAAVETITQVFKTTAHLAGQGDSCGSSSLSETSGFDTSASNAPVTHLGVVGRGVKRATPVPIANGQNAPPKRRSLEDMMTRGGAGDTQIGFEPAAKSD